MRLLVSNRMNTLVAADAGALFVSRESVLPFREGRNLLLDAVFGYADILRFQPGDRAASSYPPR